MAQVEMYKVEAVYESVNGETHQDSSFAFAFCADREIAETTAKALTDKFCGQPKDPFVSVILKKFDIKWVTMDISNVPNIPK